MTESRTPQTTAEETGKPAPACCDSVLLETCCGADAKPQCCGPQTAPVKCGCGNARTA